MDLWEKCDRNSRKGSRMLFSLEVLFFGWKDIFHAGKLVFAWSRSFELPGLVNLFRKPCYPSICSIVPSSCPESRCKTFQMCLSWPWGGYDLWIFLVPF